MQCSFNVRFIIPLPAYLASWSPCHPRGQYFSGYIPHNPYYLYARAEVTEATSSTVSLSQLKCFENYCAYLTRVS